MSTLATKAYGEIEVHPDKLFRFPEGILGFADFTEFALLDQNEESSFHWLQSTEDPSLAFVMMQPELFYPEYKPVLIETDLKSLQVNSLEECILYTIITIPQDDPDKMTANLQGPVLFNREKKLGRQVISTDPNHTVRVSVLELLSK